MLNLLEDARFPVMLIGLFGCGAPMLRLAIAAPTSVKTTSSIRLVTATSEVQVICHLSLESWILVSTSSGQTLGGTRNEVENKVLVQVQNNHLFHSATFLLFEMGLFSLREVMRLSTRHVLPIRVNQNCGRFTLHQLRFSSQSHAPHTREAITPSTSLHKPKTTTSLRKAASASQSIRETQTPTRGTIQPVWTLSTAERYSLPRLQSVLGRNATVLAESLWIPNLRKSINGSTGGEAFIFENGCVVSWGVQEEDARRFIQLNMTGRGVELGKYVEEETEEVEFVTDPSE